MKELHVICASRNLPHQDENGTLPSKTPRKCYSQHCNVQVQQGEVERHLVLLTHCQKGTRISCAAKKKYKDLHIVMKHLCEKRNRFDSYLAPLQVYFETANARRQYCELLSLVQNYPVILHAIYQVIDFVNSQFSSNFHTVYVFL